MLANFHDMTAKVLEFEGSAYTDDPHDPGGPTKWGITIGDIAIREGVKLGARGSSSWNRMRDIVKGLSKEEAITIYKTKYWDKMKCDELNSGIDCVIYDMGINAGVSRSVKMAQKLVGAAQDGAIGPQTIAALNKQDSVKFVHDFSDVRRAYYKGLKHFWRFGKGWLRRVSECEAYALKVIEEAPPSAKTEETEPTYNPSVDEPQTPVAVEPTPVPPPVDTPPTDENGDLPWMKIAKDLLGIKETPGSKNNQTILDWAKAVGLSNVYNADSIPWCGLFVAYVLSQAGEDVSDAPLWALSWKNWETGLKDSPCYGALMVFKRKGGGHVGFYVSEDATHYHILGGNQSDMVSVAKVAKANCVAWRWPTDKLELAKGGRIKAVLNSPIIDDSQMV